ncbi:MAG: AbrB/MazE/SpoVT family DNA-binding domain-containing protein [Cetobacterium sp.]
MESKELNISFYKAGNGVSARINLPKKWIVDMGLKPEDKSVEVCYDEETKIITIKKK